jgi:hypothetical protein
MTDILFSPFESVNKNKCYCKIWHNEKDYLLKYLVRALRSQNMIFFLKTNSVRKYAFSLVIRIFLYEYSLRECSKIISI